MSEVHVDPFDLYGTEILMFMSAMAYKLRRNARKGKWEDLTVEDALQYLKKEVEELEKAVKSETPVDIQMEAADVANFAMMVSELARRDATKRFSIFIKGIPNGSSRTL